MATAMALAPAPSLISVLGTAWTWNLRAPYQKALPPCRLVSLHIASAGLGEGEWLSAQTQLEMLGVKRIRCPAPELCCADPEKRQSSAYKAKELGTLLQKPPVPRPITDQLCHLEQATHRAQ